MPVSIRKFLCVLIPLLALSLPAEARNNRMGKGAVIGGVIGLAAGNGLKGAIGGAVVGGGLAAVTDNGWKGRRSRQAAGKAAVVGAVIGGVAGNGLRDALKGAVVGGAAGAMLSR